MSQMLYGPSMRKTITVLYKVEAAKTARVQLPHSRVRDRVSKTVQVDS